MALYSIANRTLSGAAGTPALEIIAAAGAGFKLREIGILQGNATSSVYGLGVPAAKGITPTSPITVLPEVGWAAAAGNTTTAVAWGTAPTAPVNFYRRVPLSATMGSGIICTFLQGLVVLKNTTLVLWNLGANSVVDVWLVCEE